MLSQKTLDRLSIIAIVTISLSLLQMSQYAFLSPKINKFVLGLAIGVSIIRIIARLGRRVVEGQQSESSGK